MCLVEISSSKKLVASCATPLVEGLDIKTTTLRVKRARQAVLEFLLINHPLDCPICDQGGECDLQDITLIFGGDRGRFFEISKRSVFDKNLGPLIKTIMNRCIHCTRCVRFFSEINEINLLKTKVPLLGLFGRGSKTEIGTYVPQIFLNEFSGNVIDLCPVGALTSKPFSFKARAWELSAVFSVDVFDNMLPRTRLDMVGLNILRILPYADINNFTWISNKTRFYFDFLETSRNDFSFLNLITKGVWLKKLRINIEDSLKIFSNFFFNHYKKAIYNLIGTVISVESFFILKEFFITQGLNNFYQDTWFLNQRSNFRVYKGIDFRSNFSLQFTEKTLASNLWLLLNIGLNLRLEAPLLFLQIARLIKFKQIKLLTFNALNYNNIYKQQNQIGVSVCNLLQFIEGRLKLSRFFFKYFIFYKCLVFLPESLNVSFTPMSLIFNVLSIFKENLYSIYSKKIYFFNKVMISDFFIISVIQKNTSNLSLYEIGLPYLFQNKLSKAFPSNQLILAYDTSLFFSTKIFKKLKQSGSEVYSILFSMNSYESSLLEKFNLIIPLANIYQINESFLNLYLNIYKTQKVNVNKTYDVLNIFQAFTTFIYLRYNYKWKAFYNSFYFTPIFNNFKKFRNKEYFAYILNLFFFKTKKIWFEVEVDEFTQVQFYLFIYFTFYIIFSLNSLQQTNNSFKLTNNLININTLNFYIETRSDVFLASKTMLKSATSFKKEYNFISFSTSI